MTSGIQDYPIQLSLPVVWGDIDMQGHMNNVQYFRYFESARAQYFHEAGLLDIIARTGVGAVVSEASCRYKKAIQFPDMLTIGARIQSIGESGAHMDQIIVSEKAGVAATGKITMVFVDLASGKKTKVAGEILAACEKMEGRKLSLDMA